MNVTLHIPDELAERLAADGGDLERRALEAFALAEYPTRYELDGFLKAHGVFEEYTLEELDREVAAMKRLGF